MNHVLSGVFGVFGIMIIQTNKTIGQGKFPPSVRYRVIELSLPSNELLNATALNQQGEVVGRIVPDSNLLGQTVMDSFHWQNGRFTRLHIDGEYVSAIKDINNSGQMVGYSASNSVPRAYMWKVGEKKPTFIPGNGTGSFAFGINDKGQIVGIISDKKDPLFPRAGLWDQGKWVELKPLTGGTTMEANRINNAGQIIGKCSVGRQQLACLWQKDKVINLVSKPNVDSLAFGINDAGDVVGSYNRNRENATAFLFHGGKLTALPHLPNFHNSMAFGINNTGAIVGYSSPIQMSPSKSKAVLWQNGKVTDLNTLIDGASGYRLESAQAINNKGEILCTEILRGKSRQLLLVPTNKK